MFSKKFWVTDSANLLCHLTPFGDRMHLVKLRSTVDGAILPFETNLSN